MKCYWWVCLFLLLLAVMQSFPFAFGEVRSSQLQGYSFHDDHLNDESDEFPNDYTPLVMPIGSGRQITVAPVITCTMNESDIWKPHYHPCKLAQTIVVDNDWSDGNVNYTYLFEDWTDYDWNDIIVNLYASTSDGVFSDIFLAFREAAWKNPFSLQITVQGVWVEIQWNSTDYPNIQSSAVNDGETIEVDLFAESNIDDKALIRLLIPPFADFLWYPANPLIGEIVVFDASASYDLDDDIVTYSWIFGNETSVETSNQTISHSFALPGLHDVELTVIDSDGLSGGISKQIEVSAIIGGETASIHSALIDIWRTINTLLMITVVSFAVLMRRKRKAQPT